MSWAKVYKPKEKPIGWWYHKILCEIGWMIRNKARLYGWRLYYKHLNECCKYGYNLYGDKIKTV